MDVFSLLPEEMVPLIFRFVEDSIQIIRSSLVCKRWREIINNHQELWQVMYQHFFRMSARQLQVFILPSLPFRLQNDLLYNWNCMVKNFFFFSYGPSSPRIHQTWHPLLPKVTISLILQHPMDQTNNNDQLYNTSTSTSNSLFQWSGNQPLSRDINKKSGGYVRSAVFSRKKEESTRDYS